MPFGLQPTHLILILVVALIVFGPSRLPEIGKSFGSMLREFQSATREASQSLTQEVTAAPRRVEPTTVPCTNCKKPIQTTNKFCPECGAAQEQPVAS